MANPLPQPCRASFVLLVMLIVSHGVLDGHSVHAEPSQYYAVRQAGGGECVVAVGVAGIAPGDTVFGTFASYAEAREALDRECGSPAPTPTPLTAATPSATPTAMPTPIATPAPRPSAPAVSPSVFASPILAIPKYDNDESTTGIFFINLDSGNAFFIDRVKRSPLSIRSRSLDQNVFSVLGRTPGQSARDGDILVGEIRKGNDTVHAPFLVDTTTGKMGYITDLASRSYRGRLRPVTGAPGVRLATGDHHYALVMYQDSSGKSAGAFLCHGSGACLFVDGTGDLETGLEPRSTVRLPLSGGAISGLGLVSASERTEAMLLVDHDTGAVLHLQIPKRRPWEIEVQGMRLNLVASFPKEAPVATPQRFLLIPISESSGEVRRSLVVDVGSGAIGLLSDLHKPDKTRLEGVRANLYTHIPRQVARPRVMTAVPKLDESGATTGAWLFDSVTGKILFLDRLQKPQKLEIKSVEERAR